MGGVQKHREGWRARLREDLRMNELQASDAPVPKLFPSLSTHAFECLPPPRSIHGLPRPHSIIQTWMKWCTFERRCELAHNHPERQRRPPSSRTCGAICRKSRSSVAQDSAPSRERRAAYAVVAAAAEQRTRRGVDTRTAVLDMQRDGSLMVPHAYIVLNISISFLYPPRLEGGGEMKRGPTAVAPFLRRLPVSKKISDETVVSKAGSL